MSAMQDRSTVATGETLPAASGTAQTADREQRHLAFTVVAHPDPERIGERAVVRELPTGSQVGLSRFEPTFSRPREDGPRRALADQHVSRTPIVFEAQEEEGLLCEVPETLGSVQIDGRQLTGRWRWSRQEVERGVVVSLSRRVVVLLHRVGVSVSQTETFGILGESDAIVQLRNRLPQLARLSVPVLIRGETGTGKELVAQGFHQLQSARDPSRPFVSRNLGEIPAHLAAAELFGTEPGAFTEARKRRGAFRDAHGGILFLDEIGEAPEAVQTLLLRVIERGEVWPVGGDRAPKKVDVRLIAATHVALEEAKDFRSDLFFRLNVGALTLPPLRERREDVGLLLRFFLRRELAALEAPRREGLETACLPGRLVTRLMLYSWPGNVRELRNVAHKIAVTAAIEDWRPTTDALLSAVEESLFGLDLADLLAAGAAEPAPPAASASPPTLARSRVPPRPTELTPDEGLEWLEAYDWNVKRTSEALDWSRTTLYKQMKRWGCRTAESLSREEIRLAVEEAGGRVRAAARRLKTSLQGLVARMGELGMD